VGGLTSHIYVYICIYIYVYIYIYIWLGGGVGGWVDLSYIYINSLFSISNKIKLKTT
jgi:hypothetical protein